MSTYGKHFGTKYKINKAQRTNERELKIGKAFRRDPKTWIKHLTWNRSLMAKINSLKSL